MLNVLTVTTTVTTPNRVAPAPGEKHAEEMEAEKDDIEIIITSHLECFMQDVIILKHIVEKKCRQKWEEEDEIMFDTDEEAIIAQNIIEEVLG